VYELCANQKEALEKLHKGDDVAISAGFSTSIAVFSNVVY
jgi:hypothetical protein